MPLCQVYGVDLKKARTTRHTSPDAARSPVRQGREGPGVRVWIDHEPRADERWHCSVVNQCKALVGERSQRVRYALQDRPTANTDHGLADPTRSGCTTTRRDEQAGLNTLLTRQSADPPKKPGVVT